MAVKLTVDVVGLTELINNFRRDKQRYIREGLDDFSKEYLSILRNEMPKRTGSLRRTTRIVTEGFLRWRITETKGYGRLVREGVKGGYPIYPKQKLALWWPGLAHPIAYVKSHPGQKANPYHLRARSRAETILRFRMVRIVNQIVND